MSNVKRYLPGNHQHGGRKTMKGNEVKSEGYAVKGKASVGESSLTQARKRNDVKAVEKGSHWEGPVGAGSWFKEGHQANKNRTPMALLLALLMVIAMAVPAEGAVWAVTNEGERPPIVSAAEDPSLKKSQDETGVPNDASQFFTGNSILTRLFSSRTTGWNLVVFSETGLLQRFWEALNMMLQDGNIEEEAVMTVQRTRNRSRPSSDPNHLEDPTPPTNRPGPGNPGEGDLGDPGDPNSEDPGEQAENPAVTDPAEGGANGDNEPGSGEGGSDGNNGGSDSDKHDTETGIRYVTLALAVVGEGTVTMDVYGEAPLVTGSGVTWSIQEGSHVTLTAVPGAEDHFLHWCHSVETEEHQIHEPIWTMDNVKENLMITAHFEEKQVVIPQRYEVNIKAVTGGSAFFPGFHHEEDPVRSFEAGDGVVIKAEPSQPYQFRCWKITDASNSDVTHSLGLTPEVLALEELCFIMPASHVVVEAIFDFDHPFEGGSGQAGDPYQIKTAEQLIQLTGTSPTLKPAYADFDFQVNLMEAHYQLVADIDLQDVAWSPIGGSGANAAGSVAFTGVFDGNQKTISNLRIDQPNASYQAMFHTIGQGSGGKKGMVKQLTLTGPSIAAKSHGAVLAVNNLGVVENVVVRDSRVTADSHVAPLAVINQGTVESTTVIDCMVTAEARAAGLVVNNNGVIQRGKVTSSTGTGLPLKGEDKPNTANPIVIVGADSVHDVYGAGLVSSNGLTGSIIESSVEATILVKGKGQKRFAGLLVSENRGLIDRSFTIGMIDREAIGGSNELINQGGLVGINRNTVDDGNSFVTNSYTMVYQASSGTSRGGAIGFQTNHLNPDQSTSIQFVYAVPYFQRTADDQIGGVLGGAVNRTLLAAYYDQTIFAKPVSGKGLGRTTDEMMREETYESWNFSTIWAIDKNINNGYPYLRWQYAND